MERSCVIPKQFTGLFWNGIVFCSVASGPGRGGRYLPNQLFSGL